MRERRLFVLLIIGVLLASCGTDAADPAPDVSSELYFVAGMAAHHLCSFTFVVGRDYERSPEQVIAEDIARFPAFRWQQDFEYEVNFEEGTATVRVPGVEPRTARYNGDQGCAILPAGESNVYYEPVDVPRNIPDPETTPWPTGGRAQEHPRARRDSQGKDSRRTLRAWVHEEHAADQLVSR